MERFVGPAFEIATNLNEPSVAALKGGNFVVTYRGFQDAYFRIVSPEGQFLSGELIADMADDRVQNPDVAGLGNGGFVVIWSGDFRPENPTSANNFDPFFRVFNAYGGSVTSVIAADVPDGINNFNTRVTPYENGFAAVWTAGFDDSGATSFGTGIAGRFFSPIGAPRDNVEWINVSRPESQNQAAATTLRDGTMVFTYSTGDGGNILIRTYDSNASPFGTEQIANQTTAGRQQWSDVAALAEENRFVVVWQHRGEDGRIDGIRGRIFETSGVGPNRNFDPVGDEIIISSSRASETLPKVAGIGGGGFVAVWFELIGMNDLGRGLYALKAQYFDAVGRTTGDELTLYEGMTGLTIEMDIAENELGALMVTWRAMRELESGALQSVVMGRILEVPVTADQVEGTPGNDTIVGTAADDVILGLDGDDLLDGGAGDDLLDGGPGNDTLIGGPGDDTLIGGEGQNTAVFSGNRDDYEIATDGAGNLIVRDTREDGDGTDTLRQIQTLQFADGTVDTSEFITDITRTGHVTAAMGDPLGGAELIFVDADGAPVLITTSAADGSFSATLSDGGAVRLDAARDWTPTAGDPAITATDALDVLRLTVGLNPSFGVARAQNYIAADMNGDGAVTALDALEVLRATVGLTSDHAPRWVFFDAATEWNSVAASHTAVNAPETGIDLAMNTALSGLDLQGILLGHMTALPADV